MVEGTQPPPEQVEAQPVTQQVLRPHRGGVILALGIISLVTCCFICGIIGWVMANKDLKEMAAGTMDPSGRGLTQAGKICGMISVILVILGIVFQIILMLLGVGLWGITHVNVSGGPV